MLTNALIPGTNPAGQRPLVGLTIAASIFLAGCTGVASTSAKDDRLLAPGHEALPETDLISMPSTPPIVRLNGIGKGFYELKRHSISERVPELRIGQFSVNGGSAYDAVKLLLSGTDFSAVFPSGDSGMVGGRVFVTNSSGLVEDIVQEIATSAGLFWSFKAGTFYFSELERFTVNLPPFVENELGAQFVESVRAAGAQDVVLDPVFNSLSFAAPASNIGTLEVLFERIAGASTVVKYDTWIWEVTLNDAFESGIRWNNFDLDTGDFELSVSNGGGAVSSSAVVFDVANQFGDNFSIGALVSFLRSHGELQTLSQPNISSISGARSTIEVSEEINYVSQVTTTTESGVVQSSAETDTLGSGLTFSVLPVFQDGSVFTQIDLNISDLIRFDEQVLADGTRFSLPQSLNRRVEATVRSMPGDYFLLGGVNMTRQRADRNELPLPFGLGGVPMSKQDSEEKTELVILMRPSVVIFDDDE